MASLKAFILCDKVIQDQTDKKHSAIGIFDYKAAGTFPCTHTQFGMILALTDGSGIENFEVELSHVESGEVIAKAEFKTMISDPLQVMNFAINWPPITFPRSGRYEFKFIADGRFVERRDLELRQIQ